MRIFQFYFLFFLTVSFCFPFVASAQDEKVFNAKSYELDNGLQLVVVENNRVPVVTHMVWYRVGAADEPPGKSGIAHFMEHLMFKGQTHPKFGDLAPGEFSKIIRAHGGEDNAFTSQDYTAYFQSISVEHLEKVMRMEAGRMRGMAPPPSEVVAENKVIWEERRQRTDNDPRAQMAEQLNEALYPNHPYGTPVIGWMHEMEELDWDDAKAFYDRYYAPNNAFVVISGDVVADEVYDLVKKIYGTLESADTPDRVRTISPPFIARSAVSLEHPSIKEAVFKRKYRVPSFRQNKIESLALQVLEEIMGGGPTARLYKSLVVEQKIATSASMSYNSAAWDDGTVSLSLVPVTANYDGLEKARTALDEALRLLIEKGIDDEEIKNAKRRLQDEAIYARDSLTGPAMIIGYNMATGSSLDDIEHWPQAIEAVTKEQVHSVAEKYLNPDVPHRYPPVEGILLPPQAHAEVPE